MDTIKTDRLTLRAWQISDADDLFEYAKSASVGPNAGWKPHESREESLDILLDFIEKQEVWALVDNESGKCVGSVGLHKDAKRIAADVRELGYVLSEKYWGRGIMTEAVSAVLSFGFNVMKLALISVNCFPYNKRSMRVIEKSGFKFEGTLTHAYKIYDGSVYDCVCYSLTAEDYKKRQMPATCGELALKLSGLLSAEDSLVTNLANACALIKEELADISWVGFYILKNDELVLGPFQGKVACSRIPLDKGVCGKAARDAESVVVDDVSRFIGHIACDSDSRSEMVIPLLHEEKVVAVLDCDSTLYARFSRKDSDELINAAKVIEKIWE